MRRVTSLAAITFLGLLSPVALAQPEIIWDNFLSEGGYDGVSFFSSETNIAIEDSWTADDAVWTDGAEIVALEWMAIWRPQYEYTAQVLILDTTYAQLYLAVDLEFETAELNDGEPVFGLSAYQGHVELPEPLMLPPGHYYYSVRLATETAGRNMVLTTGDGALHPDGMTMGIVRSPDYNLLHWTFIADYKDQPASDFAYRVFGSTFPDCNGNAVPDEIDLANGTLHDFNENGVPDECDYQPGDMDCNGVVNFDDITPFTIALGQGQDAYQELWPYCNFLNGDIDGNGVVNFDDINGFVDLVVGT